jgi:hypothetical protein
MKKLAIISSALFFLTLLNAKAQLFPKVDKVASPEMSMLVIQFAHDNEGKMENVSNLNFTGWAPVVEGPDGKIVKFRNFDAGADMTNIYYAENIEAGEYTLKGFNHLYTNYTKLDEYKNETGEQFAKYAPYENLPYHEVQFFALSNPVVINLEPNKIMSFGSFAVKYKWVSGAAGTTDDRWKAIEDYSAITLEKPYDDYVLRYIKPWRTPAWKKWNEKNLANPL